MAEISIAQFIKPFENKPIASPDQTIGQVLEYTDSSHKPIYVFDGEQYKGVVSAYSALYHNFHAPYTKKVISDLLHTPYLTKESTLHEVIRAMLDTRLYELPILDKDRQITGVIHAMDIMRELIHDPMVSTYLVDCIEPSPAITHSPDGTIKDVFPILRTKGKSRIVLTDHHEKIVGIITRSDIKTVFLRPIDRPKYRGVTDETHNHIYVDEDIYRIDDPISRYAQTNVFTISDDKKMREILKTLIESDSRSIVITDKTDRPVGIISLKNILYCLATFEPDVEIPIIFKKPNGDVSEAQFEKARHKVELMVKKLSKIRDIEKVEVSVKEQKSGGQGVQIYKTTMHVNIPGTNVTATAEHKNYLTCITNTIALIEKQFVRQKKQTYHKTVASP